MLAWGIPYFGLRVDTPGFPINRHARAPPARSGAPATEQARAGVAPLPVLLNVIILGSSKNESKIGRAAAKSGTFSERHRKATRTLVHLNFARKTRTVASVRLVGFFPMP